MNWKCMTVLLCDPTNLLSNSKMRKLEKSNQLDSFSILSNKIKYKNLWHTDKKNFLQRKVTSCTKKCKNLTESKTENTLQLCDAHLPEAEQVHQYLGSGFELRKSSRLNQGVYQ